MANQSIYGPEILRTTPAVGGGGDWVNKHTAPALLGASPLEITTLAQLETYSTFFPAFNGTAGGYVYYIVGDGTRPVIIDLRGESSGQDPARYPVKTLNFLQTFIRGARFKFVLPADGDIGSQPNSGGIAGVNRQPRQSNGGCCFYLDSWHDNFIDGCYIDASVYSPVADAIVGLETDYFVDRGDTGPAQSPSAPTRTWLIQNTRAFGCEGSDEGVHSDIFHTQGAAIAKRFIEWIRMDNNYFDAGQQGITTHSNQGQKYKVDLNRYTSRISKDFEVAGMTGSTGAHLACGSGLVQRPTYSDVWYMRDPATWSVFASFVDPVTGVPVFQYAADSPSPGPSIIDPDLHWMQATNAPDWDCTLARLGYDYSPNAEFV